MSSETGIRPKLKGFKDFRSGAVLTHKEIVRDIEIPLAATNVRCEELRVLPKAYNEVLSECSELDSRISGFSNFKKSVSQKVFTSEDHRKEPTISNKRPSHHSSTEKGKVPPQESKTVVSRKPQSSQSLRNKSAPKVPPKTSRSASDGKVFQNLINLTFKDSQREVKDIVRKPRPVSATKKDPEPNLSDYCKPSFNTEYVVKFPPIRSPVVKELPAADPYAVMDLLLSFD